MDGDHVVARKPVAVDEELRIARQHIYVCSRAHVHVV